MMVRFNSQPASIVAAHPDDALVDFAVVDDAAVGNDRVADLRPLILEAGRKRGRVKMGALMSKKLKRGNSAVKSRFASKKDRIVPTSSQYP
jgi:hypothetical protein